MDERKRKNKRVSVTLLQDVHILTVETALVMVVRVHPNDLCLLLLQNLV